MMALVMAAGLLGITPAEAAPAEARQLQLGAGRVGGGYWRIGQALAGQLDALKGPTRLEVLETGGSCDNVRRLLSGEIDMALAQYDVVAEVHGLREAARRRAYLRDDQLWVCDVAVDIADAIELQVVAGVNEQKVHWLVQRPVLLDGLALDGDANAYVGGVGSGSFETARVLFGAAGQPLSGDHILEGTMKDALDALERKKLLFILRTTVAPDDVIEQVLDSGLAHLNPLPEQTLDRALDAHPHYRVCEIPEGTYERQRFVVPTLCLSTVLLTRRDLGGEVLRGVDVEAVHRALERLAEAPNGQKLGVSPRLTGLAEVEPLPLHSASEARLREQGWLRMLWLLGSGCVVGVLVLALRRRQRQRQPRHHLGGSLEGRVLNPLVPFTAMLTVVAASTFLVWQLERHANAELRTFGDAFWVMNMFATGNFDNHALKTPAARVVGATATVMGLGVLAWFTAALTNLFSREQPFRRRSLRGHVVIVNFREPMLELVRLLRAPGPSGWSPLHVFLPDGTPARIRALLARVRGLTVHEGNPEVPDTLRHLNLPRARRVIVLGGGRDCPSAYHPVRIVRAIQHVCAQGRTSTPTVVELPREQPNLLYEPFSTWTDLLDTTRTADGWLATAVVDPHTPDVLQGMLSFADNNAELYSTALPLIFAGATWAELREALRWRSGRQGVVLVGLVDPEQGLVLNPPGGARLRAGTRLFALAEDDQDLQQVLRSAAKGFEERSGR